jgi:signal transduction histidine kinase
MDARANRFWESFSAASQERLLAHLTYSELTPGEYLFYEGDPGDGIYLILEGQMEVTKTAGQREIVIALYEADDYLGEVTVLDGQGRTTSARARGAVSLAHVPLGELLIVLDTEPVSVTLTLFKRVLSHIRCVNEAYVDVVVNKEKLTVIGEMASSLMHDLRNPVQVILSSADIIRMTHEDDATVTSCERIRVQCDRVVTMAGELLEFSRGESKLHLARTETSALLAEFLALNESYFQESGIKIKIEDEPAEVEVDSTRLLRALQNLVTNAVEALGSQTDGCITIAMWVRDSVFHVSVSDNGPGIPDGVLDHIFEPFVTEGKKGGTGLGMAIVRNVITGHRGQITFETEHGKGARFLARIPQDAASKPVI